MSRIALPNSSPAAIQAAIQAQEAQSEMAWQLFLSAFSGCVTADFQRASNEELARRRGKGVAATEPYQVKLQGDLCAQAAIQYARAGFQIWSGQKR